jgi:hypothetical protein
MPFVPGGVVHFPTSCATRFSDAFR